MRLNGVGGLIGFVVIAFAVTVGYLLALKLAPMIGLNGSSH